MHLNAHYFKVEEVVFYCMPIYCIILFESATICREKNVQSKSKFLFRLLNVKTKEKTRDFLTFFDIE